MFNKAGKTGHLCLAPNINGKAFSLSLLGMILAVRFLQIPFIRLEKVPSFLVCLKFLSWKSVGFYQMLSLHLLIYLKDKIIRFGGFILLIQCIILIGFWMLNWSSIPQINPTLPCCISLFIYFWIQFAPILLTIFVSISYWSIVSFDVFTWFYLF